MSLQADFWSDLGLISFQVSSALNAIPLCKTCHGQFDCCLDPGFLFIPTSLQFFIDFELNDRQRRKEAADRGENLRRQTPSSEQYKAEQVSKQLIPADAKGGLYMPVFLKPYLLSGRLGYDITPQLSVPRSWHGAPMASIRRCIHALSSGRLATVDREAVMKIRQLYDLYFCDDDENRSVSSQKPLDTAQTPGPGNGERKRRSDRDIEPENPHPAKKRGSLQGDSGNDYGEHAMTYCPILRRVVPACWSLGPEVSTEEAVRQFAPIIARRKGG